jgi:hypothetical protein
VADADGFVSTTILNLGSTTSSIPSVGSARWARFTAPDGAYSVELPGTPTCVDEPGPEAAGGATRAVCSAPMADTTIAVSVWTIPAGTTPLVEDEVRAMAGEPGAKVAYLTPEADGAASARIDTPERVVLVQVAPVNGRMYRISVSASTAHGYDFERVKRSFRPT